MLTVLSEDDYSKNWSDMRVQKVRASGFTIQCQMYYTELSAYVAPWMLQICRLDGTLSHASSLL